MHCSTSFPPESVAVPSLFLQTTDYYNAGQYDSAVSASRMALIWNIVSTVVGICAYIAIGIIMGVMLGGGYGGYADVTTNPPYN